jgi:hypothetical protein
MTKDVPRTSRVSVICPVIQTVDLRHETVEKEVPASEESKQHVNYHFPAIVRKKSFNKPIRV